jgi:aldose 1-epimerase
MAAALAIGLVATLAVGASAKSHHKTGKHGDNGGHGCAAISAPVQWGTLSDTSNPQAGQTVYLYTLTSGRGLTVVISNYGGIIQSIWAPDNWGRQANIALGFPATPAGLFQYETMYNNPPAGGSGNAYFGAIIGRYANRIAGAEFKLGGTTYPLGFPPPLPHPNNGPNLLHGGPDSYNNQVWTASTSNKRCDSASLILKYTDPDGKNGFPGTVDNTVTYTITRDNALQIGYVATTDHPTVINLTNHTYFNLAGEGSGDVYGQLMQINADSFTPTDANLIPTGIAPVAGTPFDFTSLKPIGRDIRNAGAPQGNQLVLAHGYDHNWVLNGGGLHKAAVLSIDPVSGRVLTTYTTEPGVQFYTGNFLVGDWVGTSGHTYRQSDGFTLETQHFPNSPNDSRFPSTELDPNTPFTSTTIYTFTTTHHDNSHHRSR